MRLKNTTNLPSDLVREVIRAVRPPGICNFDVRVSNSARCCGGRAYSFGSSYHDIRRTPFIVVRVAKTDAKARHRWGGGNGYLPRVIGSRIEGLLYVMAHELRHLWQSKHSRGKVYGSRGRFSERDAVAYALRCLRHFRRGELKFEGGMP
jgi:hypothetical protein